MREYASNSHLSKEQQKTEVPEKRVQKVVSGSVKTRENKSRKLTDVFISEDAANVKSYVVMDVIVPAFKKLVFDIFTDGIEMILYGSTGGRKSKSNGSKVSYRSYYDDKRDRRDDRPVSKSRFDYDDIIYPNRRDAEAVYSQMLETLDNYQLVTVMDMYDMAGLGSDAPYTANRFGWTNLRNAEVKRVRDGYIIDLPKAMAID